MGYRAQWSGRRDGTLFVHPASAARRHSPRAFGGNTGMTPLDEIFKRMKEHPGFYFGGGDERRSICYVQAFVTGFGLGREFPQGLVSFSHFTRWVAAQYRVWDESNDGFSLILQHVGGDERLAFDEFFRLYPAYAKDMRELGPDGVHTRYAEAMAQIPEDNT